MPIYMDFHDLPDGVTAEHVAQMHQADLKIEHKYNCRGLTYWCDEIRQTAFCLIEAPNEQAIMELHEQAHGGVPQRIIEVNDTIVESFLGRIQDPEKSKNTKLNIINDPAFRTLMFLRMRRKELRRTDLSTLQAAVRGYNKSISVITEKNNGRIVKSKDLTFLMSFQSVTNAVNCAIEIQELYNCIITPDLEFDIGISAGVPVTEKDQIFQDTITRAKSLSYISDGAIVISESVKELYESQNRQSSIPQKVRSLAEESEGFLIGLFEYAENVWQNSNLLARDLHKNLGYSKSGFYRAMKAVMGISPNEFLKQFRLYKALELMDKKNANISEVAYRSGFSSPAYFSKCFHTAYGMLPSEYRRSLDHSRH